MNRSLSYCQVPVKSRDCRVIVRVFYDYLNRLKYQHIFKHTGESKRNYSLLWR